jgi:dTDP-4-dehydrorhamnose reductase
VLDTRDREGLAGPRRRADLCHGGRTSVARTCADAGVPCALFTSAYGPGLAAEGLSLSGVLVARTGPVFTPWDRRSRAVEVLDALDRGETVRVDASSRWRAVYGPDLVDGVLDLLLDGVSGPADFTPLEGWSEAQLVAGMAEVAQANNEQVQVHGSADHGQPLHRPLSYLPPSETTLERFVREGRLARLDGELAVHRRQDEARLGEAAGSAS